MNIKTIEPSYRNNKGHDVYEFCPDRKFDDEIIICPWFGEIKKWHMLIPIFAICDKFNIKVSVLAVEDHIPLFSFYSHSLICINKDSVASSTSRSEAEEKIKYFDKHSTKCYNHVYDRGDIGWDLLWGAYAKEIGNPHYLLLNLIRKKDADLLTQILEGEIAKHDAPNVYSYLKQLHTFNEKTITNFYEKRLSEYNIFFTKNQMLSYENLVNDLDIDDSPKICSYLRSGRARAENNIDGKYYNPASGACYNRSGMEWAAAKNIGDALYETGEEIGHENIFNFNYKVFCSRSSFSWPLQDYLNQREKYRKEYANSLSTIQILLSLKNNWGYVSQAGASSFLYLLPVNIIYAEHQHWYRQIHQSGGDEFLKRPAQSLYKNEAIYCANNEKQFFNDFQIDPKGTLSNKEYYSKVIDYLDKTSSKEHFKQIFLKFFKAYE